ncbi:hypothetical protein [Stenotrophomonas sp.]|uniref:hypothetical protein n=1 Tax=Stenotrophomonas sp. TaxID=69392 RepID=UPI002FCACD77
MIVPEYWADARLDVRHGRRRLVVRRFGWSDDSLAAAQAHADARAQQALAAIIAGESIPRRERRTSYGVEGVPIREQIVERHADIVITRNSYGALCLNTPNVLFADIDHRPAPAGCVLPSLLAAALWAGVAIVAGMQWNWIVGVLAGAVVLWAANAIALRVLRARHRGAQREERALARVEQFVSAHPDWHLRAYRTPAGLRVLAMHATFAAHDPAVQALFDALQTDALYARLCRVQHCFRARLTPKPWRIGMRRRIRPPVAAWSAEQAFLPARLQWIADYERKAQGHAACRFLRAFGDERRVDPAAETVRALHDRIARAYEPLPLG